MDKYVGAKCKELAFLSPLVCLFFPKSAYASGMEGLIVIIVVPFLALFAGLIKFGIFIYYRRYLFTPTSGLEPLKVLVKLALVAICETILLLGGFLLPRVWVLHLISLNNLLIVVFWVILWSVVALLPNLFLVYDKKVHEKMFSKRNLINAALLASMTPIIYVLVIFWLAVRF
jgi:hypothetical protein